MTRRFTDYHCHLLPSIDDGSSDPQESLAMARILSECGFTVVHCTPHRIKGCYENEPERVRQITRYMQRLVHDAGIDLRLVPGTEHYMDEFLPGQLADVLCTGSGKHLLVEAPFTSGAEMVPSMLSGIMSRGMVPLIAHPERCNVFAPAARELGFLSAVLGRQKKREVENSLVSELRDKGCRFQGNLGSFAGYYGSEVRERALLFLHHGIYSCVGTDAHRSDRLKQMIEKGFETLIAAVGEDAANLLLRGSELNDGGGPSRVQPG